MNKTECYFDRTIIGIHTFEGDKMIHYFGFGYFADGDDKKPCRFVEYTFFIAPLKDALEVGISKYESQNQELVKQYITDCDKSELRHIYEHYNNGKMPELIRIGDVNIDTPDGCYILIEGGDEK